MEYTCFCSKCQKRVWKTLKTVKDHLERDRLALSSLIQSGELTPDRVSQHPLQTHVSRTEQAISASRQLRVEVNVDVGGLADSHHNSSDLDAGPGGSNVYTHPDGNTESQSPSTSHEPIPAPVLSQSPPTRVPQEENINRFETLEAGDDGIDYDSDADEAEHLDFLELQLSALRSEDDAAEDTNGADELESEEAEQEQLDTLQDQIPEPEPSDPNRTSTAAVPPPQGLQDLRSDLLGGYKCPPYPPSDADEVRRNFKGLTASETISLRHFIIWKKTGGTVIAYQMHAKLLESATGLEILSLYRVRALARRLTKFSPLKVSMCPRSCLAYTGKYKGLDNCPYIIPASKNQARGVCGRSRWRTLPSGKQVPAAYFQVLSIRQKIEALYANEDTARLLRYRDSCLKEVLHLVGSAVSNGGKKRMYSDFPNSQVHCLQHTELKLFQDPRDVAIALSTDGAQLTMKKLSNTWVLILILFNFPPEFRHKSAYVMVNFAIPGPYAPGDIESFMYPLFEEFAQGSEGYWMWDAKESSYFVNHFLSVLGNGDMLGSAKISKMAGHTAQVGDRFTTVVAARNKIPAPGTMAKALYYPTFPPENETYNPGRPAKYDLLNLPIRSQEEYYRTINRLSNPLLSGRALAKITTETGVSGLPLCASSEAFIHPTFFPLDPFHLFYENVMTFIWDIWTGVHAKEPDPVRLPDAKMKELGAYIHQAVTTLPPSFCGPIRDPYEKRNSQFKIFEWMAILHWYFIPIAIELRLNQDVIRNFAKLVRIIEFAMTPIPRSEEDLAVLEELTRDFLVEFETVYVQGIPENISRMRLCVFQLIHVPRHIKWNGTVRAGSQATTERLIGEFGRKIMSQKSPYANLSNLIYESELIKIMCLYLPSLEPPTLQPSSDENASKSKATGPKGLSQEHSVTIKARQDNGSALSAEMDAITSYLQQSKGVAVNLRLRSLEGLKLRRWGKCHVEKSNTTLRSRISESQTTTARCYRWFEADNMAINDTTIRQQPVKRIYGEAIAFYSIELDSHPDDLIRIAIYNPLKRVKHPLQCAIQGRWATAKDEICAIDCSTLTDVVGIWSPSDSDNVYILRKHPGLSFLTEDERGQSTPQMVDLEADT